MRHAHLMYGVKPSRTARESPRKRPPAASKGILDDPFARGMLTPPLKAVVWAQQYAAEPSVDIT